MNNRRVAGMAAALALMLVLVLLPVSSVYAASDFYITDYDIRMEVGADDTYRITETLDVHFTAPSHGIYRTIPYRTRLDRDGQMSDYNAKITDFTMLSEQGWKDESDSKLFNIRIGDADRYAAEDTRYSYSYVYDPGGDHFKGGDEVYMNLIGSYWEAQSIEHVTFEVIFPEDIDQTKVGIKTGKDEYVDFEMPDARTVRGETDLNVLGGLTIRAVLPEGYFSRQAKNPSTMFYALVALLAAVAAAGYAMWRKYGRDPVYPETLEFYPPDGLSAPEIAYLSKGSISSEEVICILLSLADKGYIAIIEKVTETQKRKKIHTKTEYEFEKLKEYDGDLSWEKSFMDGLFEGGKTVVKADSLENKFYKVAEEIGKDIRKKYAGRLYNEKAASAARIMYIAGIAGIIALIAISKITNGSGLFSELIMTAGSIFALAIGFYLIGDCINNGRSAGKMLSATGATIGGIFVTYICDIFYGWQTVPFFIGLAMCLLVFIMGALCEKKTDFYAETQAKINGFKRFLQTAEKDKLEELAEQDPGYYFYTLAFAFALGVTAVYVKRFASIVHQPPEWYRSNHYYYDDYGRFDPVRMNDNLTGMMTSVSSTMTSSPSSGDGGGSFSGGGGGGGGGGGSW